MGGIRTLNRISHYIPPKDWSPIQPEFVEPIADDYFIWWLFKYRCAECKHIGQEINEIIPRSRSKKSVLTWQNRIVLCRSCHEKYHKGGVTKQKIIDMQTLRINFLRSIGRTDYV